MRAQPDRLAPDAGIHHHGDAGFTGALCGSFVYHAFLQPEHFDAELDATFHDGGDMFRRAEHIHDVRQPGQALQIRVGCFAQHCFDQRAHRNDTVAQTLQTLRNPKAGARRIG